MGAHFRFSTRVCVSYLGKELLPPATSLPRGVQPCRCWPELSPKLPGGEGSPHLRGPHLVGREAKLWASAALQQLGKGLCEFETFAPRMFCSANAQVIVREGLDFSSPRDS